MTNPITRALVVGDFDPLHAGHELMLSMASINHNSVTVLVGDNPFEDAIPYFERISAVWSFLYSMGDQSPMTDVYPDPILTTGYETDADGTIISAEWWDKWLTYHAPTLTEITHVYSSDRYGKVLAQRLGAEWVPVDPDREMFPTSSTRIREQWGYSPEHYRYLNPELRTHLGSTICVLGAESTGKSTLVKDLASHFETLYVPEYGRILSENREDLTVADFMTILTNHERMTYQAMQRSPLPVTFVDTDSITTALFAEIYLPDLTERQAAVIDGFHKLREHDLYLVMAPSVPFVQDGTRVLSEDQRQQFHRDLVAELKKRDLNYVVIDHEDWDLRFKSAVTHTRDYMLTAHISMQKQTQRSS